MNQDYNNINQNSTGIDNNISNSNQNLNQVDHSSPQIQPGFNTYMQQQQLNQISQPPVNNTNVGIVEPVMQPQNNKSKKGKVGLIIGLIAGVIFAFICAILTIGLLSDKSNSEIDLKTNTFYADGYNLNYDLNWSKTSISTNNGESKDVLMYGNKEAYLIPIGTSALSELESQYGMSFKTESGKKELYDKFYSYWNSGDTSLYGGSTGFSILKGNTYYATMDYGISSNRINGKMYLIVDIDHNIIISLMSNISTDFNKNSDRVLKIIKTIDIQKEYNNELSDTLNSMSAWNQYSNLRQGKLGKNKDINGGWRILSSSETYWVFKNGEFWWYKSINDLDDNYWYGKTKVLTGKAGLKEVGLDEEKIDYITANAGGRVKADNIYTIIFTPIKIISGGEDKSSTNITGEDWEMVWIVVDHGSEGLEAQILNVKTYDTSYYVKVSD